MLNTKQIEFKRKALGFTQIEFAEKLKINHRTYANLIKSQDFRLSQLSEISKVLDISFYELFDKNAFKGDFFTGNNFKLVNGLTEKGIEIHNELKNTEQENKHLKEKIALLEEIIVILKK